MAFTREQVLARLRQQIDLDVPIIGAGAGTGISAKFEEVGGVDLIIIYNSGRFRMAGRGSLSGMMPYGDANAIVMDMAGEVLTIVEDTPVLAGVCGTDPFRQMDVFLRQVKEIGFSGVQNFPHCRPDRWFVSPEFRRDGHGLWAGGGDDSHGAPDGSADDALRF